ncbi:MAG: hypothetical protein LBI18_09420 [Planctomycetaceae bacterium]|jgi:transposase|nr:hypothetical protein [Planctomycetaceae bacterium]
MITKTTNWTQKTIKNIKKRLMDGESLKHIAESFHVSVGEMYRLCFSHGIDVHGIYDLLSRRKANPEQIKKRKKQEKERIKKLKIREQEIKKYRNQIENNRKTRENRLNHIAALRRDGATYAEIAKVYELSVERIRQIIQDYNKTAENPVTPEKFNHKRPPDPGVAVRRQKVAELRRTGLSHQQIAQKVNVSIGVIRQDLEVYNRESDNPITPFRVDQRQRIDNKAKLDIVKLRKRGVAIVDIAKKYGVVISRIYQVLSETD